MEATEKQKAYIKNLRSRYIASQTPVDVDQDVIGKRAALTGWALTLPTHIRTMCQRAQMADLTLCRPAGGGVYVLDDPEYDLIAPDGGPGTEADRPACERQARHDAAKRFAQDAALAAGHTMHFEILS